MHQQAESHGFGLSMSSSDNSLILALETVSGASDVDELDNDPDGPPSGVQWQQAGIAYLARNGVFIYVEPHIKTKVNANIEAIDIR